MNKIIIFVRDLEFWNRCKKYISFLLKDIERDKRESSLPRFILVKIFNSINIIYIFLIKPKININFSNISKVFYLKISYINFN